MLHSQIDEFAVKSGLTVMQMMEIAGLHCARVIQKYAKKNILILVGKGHNGGDALVSARNLVNWGYKVTILLSDEKNAMKEINEHHLHLLEQMSLSIFVWNNSAKQKALFKTCDTIVDGLLGFNIQGNPRGAIKDLIEEANNSKKRIIAIDLPSGLNATTGKAYNPCINAKATITLGLVKDGLLKKPAQKYVGDLFVADIGIPEFIYQKYQIKINKSNFKTNTIVKIKI